MTSQKLNFRNYGICSDIQKEHDKRGLLAKNRHFLTVWERDISTVTLCWLHTNPSKFYSVPNVLNRVKFRRICMESTERNGANISEPICLHLLIFGKLAFFILLFLKISINPIISKYRIIFVTSHFRTLLVSYLEYEKNAVSGLFFKKVRTPKTM